MADFNRDGNLDLVGLAFIALGNGDGTFQAPVNFDVGFNTPKSMAVGDFNGDGNLDMVVVGGSNVVSILLGVGDGSFQPAKLSGAGSSPASVLMGDFNADGKADLAVANSRSASVSILLGNGDGTFHTPINSAAGDAPYSLGAGDFNRDGKLDLVVVNDGSSILKILLGNGDGTFKPAVNSDVGSAAQFVWVGDFNGDGSPDLAVVNASGLSILVGNGSGVFQSASNYTDVRIMAAADFDRDGKTDLAVASSSNTSILLGNGDATFRVGAGSYPASGSIVAADFNGDGTIDLVTGPYGPGAVSRSGFWAGNGDGSFSLPATNYYDVNGSRSLAVGDFNGDGKADLVTRGSILLGNGDGTFKPAVDLAASSSATSMAVGDFNGDGNVDLAVVDGSQIGFVSMASGNGDGTFRPAVQYFTGGYYSCAIVVSDFNGDRNIDLAVLNCGSSNVSILLGNGDGSFKTPGIIDTPVQFGFIALGDFNQDGKSDLALAGSQSVMALLGNGDGTFQARTALNFQADFTAMVVGDFNADGKLDLGIMGSTFSGPYPGGPRIHILPGNGDGTFQTASYSVAEQCSNEPSGSSLAVGDFNGDGILDLVEGTSGVYGSRPGILLGNGDGTFQAEVCYGLGYNGYRNTPVSLAVGDFNGDGRNDVAVGSTFVGTPEKVSIMLNTCSTCRSISLTPITSASVPVGRSYTQTIVGTGGIVPYYEFSIAKGVLPPGLVLAKTGTLAGTPAAMGSFPFTVNATDFTGCSGSRDYSLVISGSSNLAEITSPGPGSTLTSTLVKFAWTSGTGVSQYWLYIGESAGSHELYDQDLQTMQTATVVGLPNDGKTIYVRLWSLLSGNWPYMDYTYTTCSGCGPIAAQIISPDPGSTLTSTTITFQWNSGSGVTQYWLSIGRSPGGTEIYDKTQGTRLWAVAANLPEDGNKIYIRLWSQMGGYWGFHDYSYLTCDRCGTSIPGRASLLYPIGILQTNKPTYLWNAVPSATWYQLWVNDSWGTPGKIRTWYTSEQVGCPSSKGNCSITPSTELAQGEAQWWIQAWNDAGYGPWSDALSFTVPSTSQPGKATLIAPSGTISATTPSYAWNAVTGSTWYYLWVNDSAGIPKYQLWFTAAEAGCESETGACSVTPSIPLENGAAQWWIQTWNDAGYGPWSDPMIFNVQSGG